MFRPLSQRTSPDPAFDGPYDGLPPWLFQSVATWLNDIVYPDASGYPNEALLRDAEAVLHLNPPLNWRDGGYSAISTVLNRMQTDGDFALDFLDYFISTPWTDARLAVQLDQILTRGGSSWGVHPVESPGIFQLVRREIGPVNEAIADVRPVSQRAHAHLMQAWSKLMGRNPDPSTAYREAIRAVEVVAAPVVIPDDELATLGKIIRAMQDKPDKWTVDLVEATSGQVADMAAMIWQAQFDRHGTHDENVPLNVSHEQADAAVHVAITLVRLFAGGHVRRRYD
jgi:hypothetical protein